MSIKSYGEAIPFGIVQEKPLRGFPEGHAQIVMRNRDFVNVFVRTKSGTRKFACRDKGDAWEPIEQARRVRVTRS